MEPDYKKIVEKIDEAFKRVIGAGGYHVQLDDIAWERLKAENTPWKPENGEWYWCVECNRPVMICYIDDPESIEGSENHHNEPLENYLPILEYNGFKVGENVRWRGDSCWLAGKIVCFGFFKGCPASVKIDDGTRIYKTVCAEDIQHLPPEPDYDVELARMQGQISRMDDLIESLNIVKESLESDRRMKIDTFESLRQLHELSKKGE